MFKFQSVLLGIMISSIMAVDAQTQGPDESWENIYRASATKINDLVHTKLDVKFDYNRSYLYGKEWLTLRPHFYSTDSVSLDAKGMDIHTLSLQKGDKLVPLKYEYDGMVLRIRLDKTYTNRDQYTLFIDYTSKPNELKVKGSEAIKDAKGLYFINPKGEDKNKPIQVWTQGETEGTSAWCPTIDRPNQKSTQEFIMTVPAKYVTLSNGKLVSQKMNADNTRTDTWKMDLPNAPYLFFMGVGDYAIVKDSYKGKEVNYYVEKAYAANARRIFGNTPEMMAFYSRILGVEYPWNKYSQMTARDYVSGAMENTTATLHTDALQQDSRQLVDGNAFEDFISHELFHQWFGDLVTAESWSNLTVNESFADFSESLWNEYKYGKDAGDATNHRELKRYLRDDSNALKDLVRYHYKDKEDLFDDISYAKGGCILNMLRNYVGDSAFFKSLNLYLTTNKFKNGEAAQLRLAFEEVTGEDLHWFFDQWYYGSGHPQLDIDYVYDDAAKTVKVIVQQNQDQNKVFRLPVAIDVYSGKNKKRYQVWIEHKTDTFRFSYDTKPDLVNVDGDKILLCEKDDHKTIDNFIYQYKYAGLYVDRLEAIDYCIKNQTDPEALALLKQALNDPYEELRNHVLKTIDLKKEAVRRELESTIVKLAVNDPKPTVRGNALGLLVYFDKPEYIKMFKDHLYDSSYTIAGNALEALAVTDPTPAYEAAQKMIKMPARGKLMNSITLVMVMNDNQDSFDAIATYFENLASSQSKYDLIQALCVYISRIQDAGKVKRMVDDIISFRDEVPASEGLTPSINSFLNAVMTAKKNEMAKTSDKKNLQQQVDYIQSKIDARGF